jgi:hypothetical protein
MQPGTLPPRHYAGAASRHPHIAAGEPNAPFTSPRHIAGAASRHSHIAAGEPTYR